MRLLAGAVLLAGSALTLGACGSDDSGGSSAGTREVEVAISDRGCEPARLELPAGPANFRVTNKGTSKVTEFEVLDGQRLLGEAENVTAGLTGKFSLRLERGTYTLKCPGGGDSATGTLVVTGGADAAAEGREAHAYRRYVEGQTKLLVERVRAFAAAVEAGDVARAKRLYPAARIPYERVEPVAESFGDLDPAIDARAGDVPASQWTGFHPIERALWVRGTTRGQARNAERLVADVERLERRARGLGYQPAQVANGAVELLGEVSKSKITGEEERYSHIDLVDFHANVEGAEAAFRSVLPTLRQRDAQLAATVEQRFQAVYAALERHRSGRGFVSYGKLTRAGKRSLSQAIDALAEPLSEVPAAVVS